MRVFQLLSWLLPATATVVFAGLFFLHLLGPMGSVIFYSLIGGALLMLVGFVCLVIQCKGDEFSDAAAAASAFFLLISLGLFTAHALQISSIIWSYRRQSAEMEQERSAAEAQRILDDRGNLGLVMKRN